MTLRDEVTFAIAAFFGENDSPADAASAVLAVLRAHRVEVIEHLGGTPTTFQDDPNGITYWFDGPADCICDQESWNTACLVHPPGPSFDRVAAPEPAPSKVPDLMEALQRSLERASGFTKDER